MIHLYEENIELARNWLLNSGIQNLGEIRDIEGTNLNGSFNSWLDLNTNKYPFAYSEITGYAITTLLFLNHIEKDQEFLKRAKLAADWLINVKENNIFPSIFSITNHNFQHKKDLAYLFDIGMVLNGLTNKYKATKEEKYLQESKRIANWFLELQKEDGSLPAIYNFKKNQIEDTDETWSTHSGSYHAKNSIGLINLYDLTKDQKYKNSAVKLCDYALTQQKENGRFISHIEGGTNLHPHCYSAEGLLCTGIQLNNQNYINSALKATEWILKNEKDIKIPRLYTTTFNYNQRNDVLAQSLRLTIFLQKMGYLQEYKTKTTKLLKKLIEFQHEQGGFMFGLDTNGNKLNHINAWTTMFALQALILHENEIRKEDFARFLV